MAKATELTPSLIQFIRMQPLFFVATAALSSRVNLSPKGLDSLRVLDHRRILWLSLSGSGNETAAHLREDPRMTLMFCAFEGEARILRVYGKARTIHPRDPDWEWASGHFSAMAGARQVFDFSVELAQVSCGTGVPVMQFVRQRGPDELLPFYQELGEEGVRAYWSRKNRVSLDGKDTGIEEKQNE
jgi:hypothetical protein